MLSVDYCYVTNKPTFGDLIKYVFGSQFFRSILSKLSEAVPLVLSELPHSSVVTYGQAKSFAAYLGFPTSH